MQSIACSSWTGNAPANCAARSATRVLEHLAAPLIDGNALSNWVSADAGPCAFIGQPISAS